MYSVCIVSADGRWSSWLDGYETEEAAASAAASATVPGGETGHVHFFPEV